MLPTQIADMIMGVEALTPHLIKSSPIDDSHAVMAVDDHPPTVNWDQLETEEITLKLRQRCKDDRPSYCCHRFTPNEDVLR